MAETAPSLPEPGGCANRRGRLALALRRIGDKARGPGSTPVLGKESTK